LRIADSLEAEGFSTWYYERDGLPGVSYLIQTGQAIDSSQAVVLIISTNSLRSHQVTSEVVRAHEGAKRFLPVLVDVSHVEFQNRQPEWREAIGAAASISVAARGLEVVQSALIKGLRALNICPTTEAPTTSSSTPPRRELPPADLTMLVNMLVTNAMVFLGQMPAPGSQQYMHNLPQAKHMIDLLMVLQQKSRGNLTPDEDQMLQELLPQLQMAHVSASRQGGSGKTHTA
jgi:Domain of unknown function (DUF1844)/TIR domain